VLPTANCREAPAFPSEYPASFSRESSLQTDAYSEEIVIDTGDFQ
jgi:hypothetical protein